MRYRKVQGECHDAQFCGEPEFAKRKKRVRGAKRKGVVYEGKVQKRFRQQFEHNYLASPWIAFVDDEGRLKYAQPDGLLIWPEHGLITIVEVKYQHSEAAWLQVHELYLPIISRLFATEDNIWSYATLIVVKWFDSLIKWTVTPDKVKEPGRMKAGQYGVHICPL